MYVLMFPAYTGLMLYLNKLLSFDICALWPTIKTVSEVGLLT